LLDVQRLFGEPMEWPMHRIRGGSPDTAGSDQHSYTDPATGTRVVWAGRLGVPGGTTSENVGAYLLGMYERYGSSFAGHIEGDFAVAVCNPRERTTVLARDPAGTVPLYYAHAPDGRLLFGTHIMDIVPELGRRELDPAALLDYLTFLWSLDEKTFFRGVRLVPPGAVYASGTIERYFTFEHVASEQQSTDEWCAVILATLEEAVRKTIQPHMGCHVSGGVDSSAIAVLASRMARNPIRGFVGSFPDYPDYDEAPYAQIVADQVGVELVRVSVRPEDFADMLADVLLAAEEPKGHPPILPRYLLESAAATSGCRVTLSGRGADELFTGYDWHRQAALPGHLARRTVFDPAGRARLLRPEFLSAADYDPEQAYERVLAACPGHSLLERLMALDFYTLMANWLVLDYKLSTRFGIQPAAPFLDRSVMELALRIPAELKRRDDQPKILLKEAVASLLPQEIINRKKVGFRTPMGEMLRAGLEGFVREALHKDASLFWDIFDPQGVQDMLEEHFRGTRNLGWQVWALMCVREWFRLFIEGEAWRR
jgi:asparagine synthase (glutamine-hydrolysing)